MDITVGRITRAVLLDCFKLAFPNAVHLSSGIAVQPSRFADFQCSYPLSLFQNHRSEFPEFSSAREIAQRFVIELQQNEQATIIFDVSEKNIAPQGFINLNFKNSALESFLRRAEAGEFAASRGRSRRCVVDYSSPNIAKEMHVGHMRSTILGESLCRVLEFVGHKVLRVNHLGDWGTQFGMLIEYLKEKYPNFQEQPPNLSDLTRFYKEAKLRFDNDEAFKRRAQLMVPELQSGGEFATSAWKLLCDISRRDFQVIYDRFDVSLVERGESFYNDMIPGVVQELQDLGLVTEVDGAKCLFVPEDEVPLILVKSDGGYGYDSTDIAAVKHRLKIENHDWLLYLTDVGQASHFQKIFKAAKMAGWLDPERARVDHCGFGLIQGEDGKKFKTRSGEIVRLVDLLDEAVERSKKEIIKRRLEEKAGTKDFCNNGSTKQAASVVGSSSSPENNNSVSEIQLSDEEMTEVNKSAEIVGYSAIRYFDLKQNRTSNYRFSYDKLLDPKGNTAVYLLYAYVRICSIFRKASSSGPSTAPSSPQSQGAVTLSDEEVRAKREAVLQGGTMPGSPAGELLPPPIEGICLIRESSERSLVLQILKFYDAINATVADLHLHRLTEFLYDLAGAFTSFYQNCKVVGHESELFRLHLCRLTKLYFEKSFYLLGIKTIDRI